LPSHGLVWPSPEKSSTSMPFVSGITHAKHGGLDLMINTKQILPMIQIIDCFSLFR
jgi:hypothetical protein